MAKKLSTAQSILWMLNQVLNKGMFLYSDWVKEFRPTEAPIEVRLDRKFLNHLRVFKQDAMILLQKTGAPDFQLKANKGRYFIERSLDKDRLDEIVDPQANSFMALLNGINAHPGMFPFPSKEIEKELVESLFVPEKTLGRIIYKNAFPSKFQKEFLDTFLEAIRTETQLLITPDPGSGRKPCHITPLFLVNYEGCWHLMALKGDLLQYNLSRVLNLENSDRPAEPVSKEKLKKLKLSIQQVFGANLVTGWEDLSTGYTVKIRYSGYALRYARERFDRSLWNEKGLWFATADHGNSIDVSLKVHWSWEAVSEALRWGEEAEILSPVSVRADWLERVDALAQNVYSLKPQVPGGPIESPGGS